MAINPEDNKEAWLKAISEAGGMVTIVAQKLDLDRKTVAKYRDSIEWIKEAFDEADFKTTDLAQMCLQKKVSENWKAAAWWLERKGKDRGFGREVKFEGKIETTGQVVLYFPDDGREAKAEE
jgi:hypothetical protein